MTMKRLMLVFVMVLCAIMLSSCTLDSILAINKYDEPGVGTKKVSSDRQEFWGSYTSEKIYSFDHRYHQFCEV